MIRREFEARGVVIRKGWWRVATRAGQLRIQGARLTLLNSHGGVIDRELLPRVGIGVPWYAPSGCVRVSMPHRTYWLTLGHQGAEAATEAAMSWRRKR